MKKRFVASCSLLLVFGLAETGNALTLSTINGTWTSVTGGSQVNGVGTSQIRWGCSIGFGQSGFGFIGSGTPITFNINDAFDLGDFTHYNNPILQDAAVNATLATSLSFSDPSGMSGTYTFNFAINETPNLCFWPTSPLNNDIISFPSGYASETFNIGGIEYALQLIGFGPDPSHILTQFSTVETCSNTTNLWARITATQQAPVPEPTTMLLFGTGIAGLAAVSRRRVAK